MNYWYLILAVIGIAAFLLTLGLCAIAKDSDNTMDKFFKWGGETMKMYTKKEHEEYLNGFDQTELNLSTDNFVRKPGSWIRKNDPLAFNVSYGERSRELGYW